MSARPIINVSPHLLMDVAACETKAWTRHVKGFTSKGEAIKAVAGQAFHKAMEVRFGPAPSPDPVEPLFAFHGIYDPVFARVAPERLEPAYTPDNLHRILECWLALHPDHTLPWAKVVSVETAYVSRVWEFERATVRLICRPDMIVLDGAGRYRWVDTKTTGWRIADSGWQRAIKLGLQTQLYTDMNVQRYGALAALDGYVSAIQLAKVPGENDPDAPPKLKKDGTPAKLPNCPKHGRPYAECWAQPPHVQFNFIECPTTPERVAAAVRDAERYAETFVSLLSVDDVAMLDMRGAAHGACRFCPAGEWCDASRPALALEDGNFNLMYEPYVVEEGTR